MIGVMYFVLVFLATTDRKKLGLHESLMTRALLIATIIVASTVTKGAVQYTPPHGGADQSFPVQLERAALP